MEKTKGGGGEKNKNLVEDNTKRLFQKDLKGGLALIMKMKRQNSRGTA